MTAYVIDFQPTRVRVASESVGVSAAGDIESRAREKVHVRPQLGLLAFGRGFTAGLQAALNLLAVPLDGRWIGDTLAEFGDVDGAFAEAYRQADRAYTQSYDGVHSVSAGPRKFEVYAAAWSGDRGRYELFSFTGTHGKTAADVEVAMVRAPERFWLGRTMVLPGVLPGRNGSCWPDVRLGGPEDFVAMMHRMQAAAARIDEASARVTFAGDVWLHDLAPDRYSATRIGAITPLPEKADGG